MVVVVKRKPEDTDQSMVSRFRKKIALSGILEEVRDRARYKSKSEKRKEKKYAKEHKIELEKKRRY